MIYKLEGRVSENSVSICISDSDKFAITKGSKSVSSFVVEDEFDRKDYELLDYRGNPTPLSYTRNSGLPCFVPRLDFPRLSW
jgi:hypothetical protein